MFTHHNRAKGGLPLMGGQERRDQGRATPFSRRKNARNGAFKRSTTGCNWPNAAGNELTDKTSQLARPTSRFDAWQQALFGYNKSEPPIDSEKLLEQRCVSGSNSLPGHCGMGIPEAYFVTVEDANGKSPRSELVFFECQPDPVSVLESPVQPLDLFATSENAGDEIDQCLVPASGQEVVVVAAVSIVPSVSPSPVSPELLTLGQSATDPPYEILDMFADHLGSTRLVADEQRNVISSHEYLPFGEEVSPMASRTSHMFTGHERDAGAGLDHMLARYYGANLARFLSVDPVDESWNFGNPQTLNRYGYALNNPLLFFDPNGEVVQVAVGGPTTSNGYGHVAIIVNDTVYSHDTSYSGRSDWGVPASEYFGHANEAGATQDDLRATRVHTITATPEQEAALEGQLKSMNPGSQSSTLSQNSCVTNCERPLEAAGILDNSPGEVTVTEAGDLLQAGARQSLTPEGLEDQLGDQGLIENTETRGTAPGTPATKTGTVVRGVKDEIKKSK